jgi:Ca2+-binding EF-hand superfamily protein
MAHKFLTEEKVAEFLCVFELLDKDKDGKISIQELGMVMKHLNQTPSEKDLQEMIAEVDFDGNGAIDFDEFMDLMTYKMQDDDTEEEISEAFKIIDRDSKGYINRHSIKSIINYLGENLSEEEIEDLFTEYDTDKDGQLSYDDFRDMMKFVKK